MRSQVKNFGYPKEQVQAALIASECNVEQAVLKLLS
jgi:UBA/TS-N domain